jgi:hypothetical protein
MATLVGRQGFDLVTFVLINGSLGVAFLGPVLLRRLPSRAADIDGPPLIRIRGTVAADGSLIL